jgi:hypothetical protein
MLGFKGLQLWGDSGRSWSSGDETTSITVAADRAARARLHREATMPGQPTEYAIGVAEWLGLSHGWLTWSDCIFRRVVTLQFS